MAATAAAARLTEAHRQAQIRLGISTVGSIRSSWKVLDPSAVDATTRDWLRVAVPLVAAHRTLSAQLARTYLAVHRQLEVPGAAPITASAAPSLDARRALVALTVTGPYALKAASARGVPLQTATSTAGDQAAGAAMRLALDGGRQTITDTVAADPKALGWARATSGEACAFCALLASRGPVFSEASVDFEAHDHCSCTPEPIYHRDADWPSGARDYRDLYDQVAKGDPDPLNAFRRELTAQRSAAG
jgi:hypothetical protein